VSPSLVAAVNNNDLGLQKISENGADVNQMDSSGNSLLIVSSANGHSEMVKLTLTLVPMFTQLTQA